MSQSLSCMHTHLVFSTKHREPRLSDAIREPLHAYMGKGLCNLGCLPQIINSVEDHIHLLFELGRQASISVATEEVKKSSSKWLKGKGREFSDFAWQSGYGAFSVSESQAARVEEYIARQAEHLHRVSFQEEYLAFIERHRIRCNERFLWD